MPPPSGSVRATGSGWSAATAPARRPLPPCSPAKALPAAGTIERGGSVGYLPQDPRTGDLDVLARDRVLSGRGLDVVVADLRAAEDAMAAGEHKAIARYGAAQERLHVLGGYAAEAEASSVAASLGLADRVLSQPLRTLSGGQRRRVELARILFSGADTLLLDEPTNHLDADSIVWLRDFLRGHRGGLVVISHDVELLELTVNKVFHLDATRAVLDIYNVGWRAYLAQRETDERRRKRERSNAEKKAAVLNAQADRMRAKATKAVAAQQMAKRATKLLAGLEDVRQADKVARLRFPEPAPCGRVPLTAAELSKSYGSLEVFTDVDLAIDRGSRVVVLGLNGAGKTTLLRILAGVEPPDTGEVNAGHGLRLGYYAQEHETLDPQASVLANLAAASPDLPESRAAQGARLVPVQRRHRAAAGRHPVRRREDPARAGPPRRVERQRAAARRADEQPRPGQPRPGARCAAVLPRARSCWSPTTRARSPPSTRNASCCCPTASRTTGARSSSTSLRWPERLAQVGGASRCAR